MSVKTKKAAFSFLIIANLAIIIFFWGCYSGPWFSMGRGDPYIALGRLAGLLAVFLVLLQLLFMSRVRFMESAFGLDKLSLLHHYNGEIFTIFVIAHPVFLTVGYALNDRLTFFSQLWDLVLHYEDVSSAAIGLVLLVFIAAYSVIFVFRHWNYEWWYRTHLLAYLAVLLAFGHQTGLGGDFVGHPFFSGYWILLYAAVFAGLLLYRFMRPVWYFYKYGFYVKEVKPESENVTSVYIGGKNLDKFKVLAGQFMIFRFLGKGWWQQAHPFSLSMYPGQDLLRISVKNVGDYTSHIKNLKPGTKVLIDGPYGIFTRKVLSGEKILFIAGGIGITPIRSLIEQFGKEGKNMVLLYANRTEQDITFKRELRDLTQQYRLAVNHILSRQQDWAGEKGRIDEEKIKKLAPDFLQREVYLCGPLPMTKDVVKILIDLGMNRSKIHFENFSLQ
ncbi:MAG: ferredoxin reductase family protein [Patescibacteria group bacterium]|nr:ferredoxin reductase family protein [Patescibacteria group bacterium]